jgi:hypothetical protein
MLGMLRCEDMYAYMRYYVRHMGRRINEPSAVIEIKSDIWKKINFSISDCVTAFALESRDTGPAIVSYKLHGDEKHMEFTSLSDFKDSIYGFLINGLNLTPENPLTQHPLTRPVDPRINDIHTYITGVFSCEFTTGRKIYPRVDHVTFEIRHNLDEVRVYLATDDRAPRWVLSKDLIEHEIGVFVCIEDLHNLF